MGGYYRVILADPPWAYQRTHGHGIAARQYQTLTLDTLKSLPVADLADKNAALFLWATFPQLAEALDLMRAWEFTFKTCAFTWVKTTRTRSANGSGYHLGLGHYTRANAEIVLLGIRGRMLRKAANVGQIIATPKRQHSRKPDEQYDRIMRLFDGPYLELFARQQWPGWDVWGNQAGKFPAQPFLIGELAS